MQEASAFAELVRQMTPDQLVELAKRVGIDPERIARDLATIWLLREKVVVVSAGAATERVSTKPAQEGWHWVVTAWSVETSGNAATSIRVAINSGDEDYDLAEQVTAADGVLYHDTTVQVISHNEQFVAKFVGTTATDVMTLTLHGFQLPPESPVSPALLMALTYPQRTF